MSNPFFQDQRERALNSLDINNIDIPIQDLIDVFTRLQYCFTLQCCYGHFVHEYQKNEKNVEPLSRLHNVENVRYRIAYIALCIQDSQQGRKLFNELEKLTSIDPDYVQFGCADWFWERQVNSYALQVEPDRYKTKDEAVIGFQEALHVEKVRNEFIEQFQNIVSHRIREGWTD